MEKAVLLELGMSDRDEVVAFLKGLWNEQPTPCQKCGSTLAFMHKKAKKSIVTGNAQTAVWFIKQLTF